MTANALPEDREACFAAGMDDYVAKPIRPEELAQALGRTQRRHHRNRRCQVPASDATDGLGLDPAALESLRKLGGDDFLVEVIDTFLGDAPRAGRHAASLAGWTARRRRCGERRIR